MTNKKGTEFVIIICQDIRSKKSICAVIVKNGDFLYFALKIQQYLANFPYLIFPIIILNDQKTPPPSKNKAKKYENIKKKN